MGELGGASELGGALEVSFSVFNGIPFLGIFLAFIATGLCLAATEWTLGFESSSILLLQSFNGFLEEVLLCREELASPPNRMNNNYC